MHLSQLLSGKFFLLFLLVFAIELVIFILFTKGGRHRGLAIWKYLDATEKPAYLGLALLSLALSAVLFFALMGHPERMLGVRYWLPTLIVMVLSPHLVANIDMEPGCIEPLVLFLALLSLVFQIFMAHGAEYALIVALFVAVMLPFALLYIFIMW